MQPPVFVDLFCGGGGASLGLRRAGLHESIALDSDAMAVATLNADAGPGSQRAVCADIRKIDALPAADLWWASPPCQDFSTAGRERGSTPAGRGARSGRPRPHRRPATLAATRSVAVGVAHRNTHGLWCRMAGHTTRDVALTWWTRHHKASAAQVAAHFAGPGRDQLPPGAKPPAPGTLRVWKSRCGLPAIDEPEPAAAGLDGASAESRRPAAFWERVHTIHPWERNPRVNDHVVEKVAASIRRFGYGRSFVAWRPEDRRMLVVGHTARKAVLHNLKHYPGECPPEAPAPDMVPVRWRSDWTEPEARAYAIADNRLSELSGWVDDELARQLQELQDEHGIAASLLGVADDELADLLAGLEGGGGGGSGDDGAPAIPVPEVPASVSGAIYKLGPHRLVCGDCGESTVWASILEDGERLQAIVTDPPYGIDYTGRTSDELKVANDALEGDKMRAFLARTLGAALACARRGACLYVFGPQGAAMVPFVGVVFGLGARWTLVWVKDRFTLSRSDYHQQHELVWYGWKPGGAHHALTDRTQSTRLDCPRPAASKEHPTMKPVELIARLIENSSKPGWLVGDGFGGSGTTLIAAAMTGRRARLVEIEPGYCDVIRQRWWRWCIDNDHEPGPDALPIRSGG